MKLALFLCALFLSLNGWCAAVSPSHPAAQAISAHEISAPLVFGSLVYLALICWWAISARNALNKTLKNVLEDIAGYAS